MRSPICQTPLLQFLSEHIEISQALSDRVVLRLVVDLQLRLLVGHSRSRQDNRLKVVRANNIGLVIDFPDAGEGEALLAAPQRAQVRAE